jgi:hypothetical protein
MTETYTIKIRFKGKKAFETFQNITEYSLSAANSTFFWMKKMGAMDEKTKKFTESLVWYPFSEIEEITCDSVRDFANKKEISEFKQTALSGRPYEQK